MKLNPPQKRVHIQIKQLERGSQVAKAGFTKSLTVYDTTTEEVYDIILKSLTQAEGK